MLHFQSWTEMDVVLNDELCCCVWADRPLSRAWGQCSAAGPLCTAFDWGTPLPHYPIEPSFTDTLVEWLSKWAVYVAWRRSVLLHSFPKPVRCLCKFLCKLNSSVSLSMFIYILWRHHPNVCCNSLGLWVKLLKLPHVCNYIKVP